MKIKIVLKQQKETEIVLKKEKCRNFASKTKHNHSTVSTNKIKDEED